MAADNSGKLGITTDAQQAARLDCLWLLSS
jgi:hypothetical protein